jgi:predicted DNA-binding protein
MANIKQMEGGRKVSIYLPEEVIVSGKEVAKKRGTSFSALIREAVRKDIKDTVTVELEMTLSAKEALERRAKNTGFTVPGLIKLALQEKFKKP